MRLRLRSSAAILCVLFAAALSSGCRQEKTVTFQMRWGPDTLQEERTHQPASPNAVMFQFEHVPCYEVVLRAGLLEQLQAKGRVTVPVEFELTSSLGGWSRGLAWTRLTQIDGQPYMAGPEGDYGGCQGSGISPFEDSIR